MRTLSKYFTSSLTSEERESLFNSLGLAELEYEFVECAGNAILSRCKPGIKKEVFLEPALLSELLAQPQQYPRVFFRHPPGHLSIEAPCPSFWNQIFPFPFCMLRFLNTEVLEVSPASFHDQLCGLRDAFLALEMKMAESEANVLSVKGLNLVLVFHFVRRKLIRVGVHPGLSPLPEEPKALGEIFGTKVGLFCLHGAVPFPQMKDAITEMIAHSLLITPQNRFREIGL